MTTPTQSPSSDPISDDELFTLIQKTAEVFSPSAPIDQQQLFSGRVQQLFDVMNALGQKGQHAILFGERGVGKTSLATVILALCKARNVLAPMSGPVNCDSTMTFSSLWKRILRGIAFTKPIPALGFLGKEGQAATTLDTCLPDAVTPDDVRHLLSNLPKTVIVIDELDRADRSVTALLADTIKNLSDHAVDTTLLLVGVADSVDALIHEHQSVERALVQIRMPRMSSVELLEIIDKGIKALGMAMGEREQRKIAKLSQGLPHYTHLLSLHATQHALQQRRRMISGVDVTAAIQKALTQAQQSVISAHTQATSSPRDNLYPQVLLACALADTDELGYFPASAVRGPMSDIMGKPYDIPAFSQHLNAFCDQSRGPVLQRAGTARRYRFRFVNPLLQPYVLMKGVSSKMIAEDRIEA